FSSGCEWRCAPQMQQRRWFCPLRLCPRRKKVAAPRHSKWGFRIKGSMRPSAPRLVPSCVLLLALWAGTASATQLTEKTRKAFETYVSAAESRMQRESREGKFLWTVSLDASRREDVLDLLGN